MTTLREAAQQAQQALEALAGIDSGYWHDFVEGPIAALRTALAEQPAEQESVQDEYNRVINHAIEQGIEASVFLRCWQEGDWSGCAEFGFEPNMAAYTAPQPAIPPGYKLVPIQKLVELKASIHGEYFRGTDWELETISTMLIAAAPEAPQPTKQPLIADEICDSWEFITGHQIQFGPSSEGRPMYLSTDEVIEFARAIERAHGILSNL